MATKKEIRDIEPADVYVAYRGPYNVCSCGCAGDWKHNPEHKALVAIKHQGLLKLDPRALAPKFSLRYITQFLNVLQENADDVVNIAGEFFLLPELNGEMYKIETVAGITK
jgi:hypothetical protein